MNSLMIRKVTFTLILLMASLVSINVLFAKAVSSTDKTGFSQVNDFKKTSTGEQWFAWKVELIEGQSKICCVNNQLPHTNQNKLSCICDLENKSSRAKHTVINIRQPSNRLSDMPDEDLIVYLKVVKGAANKLVVVSNSCKVNANNNTILWLDNITAKDSLSFLLSTYDELNSNQQGNSIEAIAYHREESATAALIKLYKKFLKKVIFQLRTRKIIQISGILCTIIILLIIKKTQFL